VALHRRAAFRSSRSPVGRLIGSVAVFLAVESFFQFPFEMAFPALTAAVTLGLAGASLPSPDAAKSSTLWRLAVLAALALAGYMVVRVARAEILWVAAKGDVRAQEEACRLDPRRLEACVDAAWLRSQAGDHETARRSLERLLERSPHYVPALKLLGEEAMATGDRTAGCRYLGLYDALLDGRTALHERVAAECGEAAGSSKP
jgi:hypothetical protein